MTKAPLCQTILQTSSLDGLCLFLIGHHCKTALAECGSSYKMILIGLGSEWLRHVPSDGLYGLSVVFFALFFVA